MAGDEPGTVQELHPEKKLQINQEAISLATRQQLEDCSHSLAFLQFALTGREVVELNGEAQAGLDTFLGDIRDKLKQAAEP